MLSVLETVNLAYRLHEMTTGYLNSNHTTMSIENVLQSLALSHVANSKVIHELSILFSTDSVIDSLRLVIFRVEVLVVAKGNDSLSPASLLVTHLY